MMKHRISWCNGRKSLSTPKLPDNKTDTAPVKNKKQIFQMCNIIFTFMLKKEQNK